MSGRDKDATRRRSLSTHCRECDWSRPRAIYELQNGLPFRTVPPGHEHEIDWHDPNQLSRFDLSASTMEIWQGAAAVEGTVAPCFLTVGIEVAIGTVLAGSLACTEARDSAAIGGQVTTASASVQWAIATTRTLRDENKIPQGATQAELARLLEAEAKEAVKAGRITRALKASYLENQLIPWGIWPLNSFK
jgi:hypothetical protein